ncbi:MAG: NAD-dependent epimerase/dehydratase family protein [Burkholderiales bacterium]|nr:NAD-dependent epimerase/dehydratase family protein [Burkholderiales bacterium]
MKTAAVTGGSGFVGRHLVARLVSQGWQVRLLSRGEAGERRANIEHFRGDLTRDDGVPPEFLDGVDVLFNCAGEIRDESRMMALHVEGTDRLISAARGRPLHWIQLSSVGAYGPRASGIVLDDDVDRPVGVYEATKASADLRLEQAIRESELRHVSILRPSIIFGDDMPNASLAQWVEAIRRGRFIFIGPVGAIANYVHVESVVDALLCSAWEVERRSASRRYIVSEHLPMEEFVETVCVALRRPTPRMRIPLGLARRVSRMGVSIARRFPLTPSRVEALSTRVIYASDRARQELRWFPGIPLTQGLAAYVAGRWRHG